MGFSAPGIVQAMGARAGGTRSSRWRGEKPGNPRTHPAFVSRMTRAPRLRVHRVGPASRRLARQPSIRPLLPAGGRNTLVSSWFGRGESTVTSDSRRVARGSSGPGRGDGTWPAAQAYVVGARPRRLLPRALYRPARSLASIRQADETAGGAPPPRRPRPRTRVCADLGKRPIGGGGAPLPGSRRRPRPAPAESSHGRVRGQARPFARRIPPPRPWRDLFGVFGCRCWTRRRLSH